MSQVSKYLIRKDVFSEIFEVFLQTIVNLHSRSEVSDFFDEFLTPTERIMFAKRLAIGLFIANGYSYKEIKDLLKVSSTTISDYSIFYKYGTKYKKIIDKIIHDKEIDKFLLNLAEKISSLGAIGGAKSSGWFNLRNNIKKRQRNRVI